MVSKNLTKKKRASCLNEVSDVSSLDSSRGPFMLHSKYLAAQYLPEHCYTSKPVDIDDPKAVRKLLNSLAGYLGRLQRRSSAGSHLKRRGRKWEYKNRIAWMMMHDRPGEFTWMDVYRKVRIIRDLRSRRKLQTAFSVARMRHAEEFPDCSLCRTFDQTIPERRRKLAA